MELLGFWAVAVVAAEFLPGFSLHLFIEECGEGPGFLCLYGVVVVDVDLVEERLVEQSADSVRGYAIDGVTVVVIAAWIVAE